MEYEKCSRCNGEIYGSLNGIPFCAKHYVENYEKDKRFLHYKLNQLLDLFSREQKFTEKEKEFLREIIIQFPEAVEEYSVLFEGID